MSYTKDKHTDCSLLHSHIPYNQYILWGTYFLRFLRSVKTQNSNLCQCINSKFYLHVVPWILKRPTPFICPLKKIIRKTAIVNGHKNICFYSNKSDQITRKQSLCYQNLFRCFIWENVYNSKRATNCFLIKNINFINMYFSLYVKMSKLIATCL